MDRPKLEVADIFRRYGEAYRDQHGASMSTAQRRVMTAIEVCRTAALGGQIEQCDECGHQRICYRSCRNRHCPKCQSLARAEWIIPALECAHALAWIVRESATLQGQTVLMNLSGRGDKDVAQMMDILAR